MDHKIHLVPKAHQLGLFGFLMLTVSMVVSIYIYPTFATSGFSTVFFLLISGFLWFIPVCLVAAELATGGQHWCDAGVYSWGKAAFGELIGFCMIFFQWFQITLGFVAMLYFISSGLSYSFDFSCFGQPGLMQMALILIVFWVITLANFFGTRITKLIATYAFFIGILFPILILIVLGVTFLVQGNSINITFSAHTFFPDFSSFTALVLLVSFILSFMGAEASAVHVNHLRNPARNYPLAIFILVILTVGLATLASLTISMVIPKADISLSAGIFESFKFLFHHFGLDYVIYSFAFLITMSAVGEVSSWVNGPIRGIQTAAQNGLLPPALAKTNKHMMPTRLLLMQGCFVTFWAILITSFGMALGSGNVAFFTGMTLTVIIYLTMYMLLFSAYIYLKFKVPDKINPRKFSLPVWFGLPVALIGLIFTVIAFLVSFSRPTTIASADYRAYLMALIICLCVILLLPITLYALTHKYHNKWALYNKEHKIGNFHQ